MASDRIGGGHASPDPILDFWTAQAREHGESPAASWSDQRVIELEIREIGRYVEDGSRVLDVGCANGYASARYAERDGVELVGVDYVPEMIAAAESRRAALAPALAERLRFQVGDVRSLELPDAAFDRVVSTRVIINLPSPDEQAQGLRECARVLRPGGLLLLSEATVQGWERLNALRREWGLEPIPMPWFNRYLDEGRVVELLAPELALERIANFASTYYVVTRLLKPLLAAAAPGSVDVADPEAELPAAGDYGTQKLFVFRKAPS